MKPQTVAFLAKSCEFLEKARELLDVHHWPDEAGRAAYLAGLHAAQAFIFEPRFDVELRSFLPRAYNLKAIADYATGSDSTVSTESAREAVQAAQQFVERVTSLIPP